MGEKIIKKILSTGHTKAIGSQGQRLSRFSIMLPYLEETDAGINQLVSGASYCSNSYCPKNHSGDSYGMVTLRTAFAQSYNTPAIRLFEKTGGGNEFQVPGCFRL
ncbi:hypothetical protein RCO48_14735 [Peribacillus frigoritolerans]|nr:hypothetical protein [Peribacillus frigoritolerans]